MPFDSRESVRSLRAFDAWMARHERACGIDCGSTAHFVAVPPDRDATPVQSFRTFTTDLHCLADWLVACGVTSVAMEATGVFWIPVYEILEHEASRPTS